MKNKLFRNVSIAAVGFLVMSGAVIASSLHENDNIEKTDAAVETIYTHKFASGDFRTDRWWGVDGDVFWGDAMSSIESDGGTFIASEYLRRFVYDNSSGKEIDNIYIPVHFTGDVTVVLKDDDTGKTVATAYYHNGDNAISFTNLNTTAKKLAANVNRTSGSANSTTRVLYGETVVISRTSSFKVSFNANGGSGGPSPVDVEQGAAMPTISSFPTRTGYTFAGYYDAASGGTKYYNANGSSAKNWDKAADTTLYAHWTANSYTIAYNGNKPSNASSDVASVPASHSATYDANVTLGSAPTLTGWTFGGWYKESGCTNKVGNAGQTVSAPNLRSTSGTATLYAKWTANTYTVAYNDNKPSNATGSVTNVPSSQTWTYDNNATLGSAPSLTGWTFGGWYKEAACTNKAGNASQTLTKPNYRTTSGTVNLYAKWIPNTYTVVYNGNKPQKAPASYNVTNIPGNDTWTYDSSASVTLGSAPSLTGYVFSGWYKEAACTNKLGDAGQQLSKPNLTAINNGTVNLYAKWIFDPAIQDVVDKINNTKVVSYDDLTSQINIADSAYNSLSAEFKAVVDSEGYTHILDNAKAADAAGQMIEDLGPAQDTQAWRNAVSEARAAYNALEDKTYIPTATILRILEDDEAAVVVMNIINNIGDPRWTDTCKNLIDTAQDAYDAYIAAGHPHAQIANYQTLVDAHIDYNNVQAFVDKVNAITNNPFEYTPECKALIDAARDYYENTLDDDQQAIVHLDAQYYYDLLVNYENAYNAMYLIDQINDMEDDPSCGEKISEAREAIDALNPSSELPLINSDLMKELVDKEAAWNVMELINAIYPMVYGEDCENAIEEARNAFIALEDDQEQYVVNYDKLTKAEEDYAAVEAVVEQVAALGDIRHDKDSKDKIDAAREAYENLTEDQKNFYPDFSLQDIVDYETSYEALDKIYAIGDIGYDTESEDRIKEAREFYDSLSEEQKTLIHQDDLAVLTTAEGDYASMKKTATIWVIILIVLASLTIIGGIWFLIFLLKRKKNEKDDDKGETPKSEAKPVKVASFGGLLPLIILTSYYAKGPYVALYILCGLAVAIWIACLVVFLVKKNKKQAVNEEEEESVRVTDEKGNIFEIRFVKSFTAKLIQANDEAKKYYEELKNEVLSYKNTSSRVSWHYDSINSGRNQVLKFVVRGKSLCVYYPLNADDYAESKYKVEKIESKKFSEVPCLYRIKNDRRLSYAKELIAEVCKKLGLEKGKEQKESYVLPYEENKPLIERGLIKELKVQVNKPAEEEVLESKVNAEGDEILTTKDAKGNIFEIRFIKSFTAKLSQASDEVKDYYNILKNYALSYKGSSSRVSWHFDSINVGRDKALKFAIRGKTLCVYFALKDEKLDEKYKFEEAKSKKFEEVPVLYRIKNDRRLDYAKELIDLVMKKLGASKGKELNDEYRIPYEETKVLLGKGLIKEVKTKVSSKEEHLHSISVAKADELMSDEKAESAIEEDIIHHHREGKKEIINIDTLSQNYNDGDTVDLDSLIEKKLVPAKTGYVKVLARGVLDKRLIVDLDDFSLQAVKMIVLLGGHAKKIK